MSITSLRTFIAVAATAGLVACVDGDDIYGGKDGEKIPPHLRSFELDYDGQKLSWRPTEGGERYQGLMGTMKGENFDLSVTLLSLDKGSSSILREEGYAGIMWKAPGGELAKGEQKCTAGGVVMAIQFPHVGHLVTHADAINGGAGAMANPVTEGVDCLINVTRADGPGGFVEGTIKATLAFVEFDQAPPATAVLKQLAGKFKLVRSMDAEQEE